MKIKLFKKTESMPVPVVVNVPDIKDYLVKEYERVQELKRENERLEEALELAREIKLKYEAALVTLDEYAKRMESAKAQNENQKQKTLLERKNADALRDELNSYKIKLANAAITRDQIKDDIIEKTKEAIVLAVESNKGTLSKKRMCEIVLGVSVTWKEAEQ